MNNFFVPLHLIILIFFLPVHGIQKFPGITVFAVTMHGKAMCSLTSGAKTKCRIITGKGTQAQQKKARCSATGILQSVHLQPPLKQVIVIR